MDVLLISTGVDARILLSPFLIKHYHDQTNILNKNIELGKYFNINGAATNILIETNGKQNKIEGYFRSIQNSYKRRSNYMLYAHYIGAIKENKNYDLFLGNKYFYNLSVKIFHNYLLKSYNDKYIKSILHDIKPKRVFVAGYYSSFYKEIILNCPHNTKNILFINSNKDAFIDSYIPFKPQIVYTWNNEMKKIYERFNPQIDKKYIVIGGNPRLEEFRKYRPSKNIDFYKQQFNISEKYLLYTCANPKVVTDEFETVKKLITDNKDFLKTNGLSLLIRTNPMDNNPQEWKKLADPGLVDINIPEWIWDFSIGFNMPSKDAEIEWKDILFYSQLVINVASTVSFEALLMGKPVLNTIEGLSSSGFRKSLFHSDFYQYFQNVNGVYSFKNNSEFVKYVVDGLKKTDIFLPNDILVPFNSNYI